MTLIEQCEAIWPLGWVSSEYDAAHSNNKRWLFRVDVVPEIGSQGYAFWLNGAFLGNVSPLRDGLLRACNALRERESATDQTVPPIRQPPMIDRLSDLLCPKGWELTRGVLTYPGPLGHLIVRHLAGGLELLPQSGGRVHMVALDANASDDEVKKALSDLLSFPRYP